MPRVGAEMRNFNTEMKESGRQIQKACSRLKGCAASKSKMNDSTPKWHLERERERDERETKSEREREK